MLLWWLWWNITKIITGQPKLSYVLIKRWTEGEKHRPIKQTEKLKNLWSCVEIKSIFTIFLPCNDNFQCQTVSGYIKKKRTWCCFFQPSFHDWHPVLFVCFSQNQGDTSVELQHLVVDELAITRWSGFVADADTGLAQPGGVGGRAGGVC